MGNAELQMYLANFPGNEDVGILVANPKNRKLYKCENVIVITDYDMPVICIEIGEGFDMDAEMIAECENCEKESNILEGQMNINDYPGVVPLEVKHD